MEDPVAQKSQDEARHSNCPDPGTANQSLKSPGICTLIVVLCRHLLARFPTCSQFNKNVQRELLFKKHNRVTSAGNFPEVIKDQIRIALIIERLLQFHSKTREHRVSTMGLNATFAAYYVENSLLCPSVLTFIKCDHTPNSLMLR